MAKLTKDTAKRILLFYWHCASRYRLLLVIIALALPLAVITSQILPPLVLASVIDRLSRQDFVPGQLWPDFAPEILIYAALVITSGLVVWRIVDMTVWHLEGRVQRDLARRVFNHLMDQSSNFHANHFGGTLVSQNNKLMAGYIRIADTTIFNVLPLLISVITAAVILYSQAPAFAISLVIFAVSYIYISFIVSKPVRRQGARQSASESKQTGMLSDAITNAMAIKSFAKGSYEEQRFAKATETTRLRLMDLMRSHQHQMIYFTSMTGIITAGSLLLAIISVVLFGARVATAFLIFSYTASIVTQLFQFSNMALRNYNRAVGDASDMVKILDTPAEIKDPEVPEEPAMYRGRITFKNVSFAHKDADDAIFNNLNISIKPGEKVGLVGHSGSGKTTFTRLLLRFSDIDHGSIEIDGQNITAVRQDDLRRAIAYVPQEPLLFHRTIAENIAYSDPDAPIEQIRAVAKKANATEFIDTLPKGYDTLVGERGIKLSGGQRQRIAIARAMLKNAPILVLDEATSALDSESEALIQDALWKLMEGRTAIVIAHRLSTIQRMDRIVVLDNGRIAEQGSHKDLLYRKSTYAGFWQRQSGGFLED